MPGESPQAKPISLFYSYSHRDEDLRLKLQEHLAPLRASGTIAEWHDRDIEAGKEWEKEIDHHLSSADIILLLVSASFIASEYCWSVEIKKALERHERGEARVIPVILRPSRWQRTPFAKLQATPKDARPVTAWPDEHAAFDDVVSKIEAVVVELQRRVPNIAVFRDIDATWSPEMVALPAGKFLMGSPESEKEKDYNEGPLHRVTIASRFALGRYPVTFAEYDHFCDKTKRDKLGDEGWGRGRRPVINVSWRDAQAYCEWLAEVTDKPYRLPSEAEWEYACRAETTTPCSFGKTISTNQANYDGSSTYGGGTKGEYRRKTTEGGSFPPNPWGLYDMHGNVWEWCADGLRPYTSQSVTDPMGPVGPMEMRVVRGGSWFSHASYVRSARRHACGPGDRYDDFGFRCARVLS